MSVVEHLLALIRIPSVSAMPNRPVVEYAAGVLRGLGWTTREVVYTDAAGIEKVNLIAAPEGQDVAEREVELAFVCHTDTVPHAASWAGATAPEVRDGFVYGCGSCDVKGFLACLLAAATARRGEYAAGLRIVLTADEEVGCVGAKRLLEAGEIRARSMVAGEPTQLRVARAGKGYCLARMVFTGREAHSAHPERGVSAIYAAARMVVRVEEFGERLKAVAGVPGDWYTTVNVGTIAGGTAKNIVPGRCEFLVEWRPVAGQDSVLAELEKMATEEGGCGCRVEVLRLDAGFETPPDAGLVLRIEEMAGRGTMAIPFGSEASVFAAATEEIVVFGAGDMRTAHSERECVPVAELEAAVRVVAGLIAPD